MGLVPHRLDTPSTPQVGLPAAESGGRADPDLSSRFRRGPEADGSSRVCHRCGYSPAPGLVEECCPRDGLHLVARSEHREAPRDLFLGTTVGGKYPVLGVLGRGGMGAVYRSVQPLVEREVAIKLVLPNKAVDRELMQRRFLREARAVASLSHPTIVTLHDFGVERDGTAYMVMELVRGRGLSRELRGRELTRGRLVQVCLEVLEALDAAHRQGLVHRDLKPDNIMLLDAPSERYAVKVLDFGLAKLVTTDSSGGQLTRTGMLCGTPQYMAPAQATGGPVDARTDLYALGVLLYQGLAGRPPFEAEQPLAVLQAHVSGRVPDLPEELPPGLRAVVRRALAKRREDRYDDATAMGAALAAALDEVSEEVRSSIPESPEARARGDVQASALLATTLDVSLDAAGRPLAAPVQEPTPPLPKLCDAFGGPEVAPGLLRSRRARLGVGAAALAVAGLVLWLRPGDGAGPQGSGTSSAQEAAGGVSSSRPVPAVRAAAPGPGLEPLAAKRHQGRTPDVVPDSVGQETTPRLRPRHAKPSKSAEAGRKKATRRREPKAARSAPGKTRRRRPASKAPLAAPARELPRVLE